MTILLLIVASAIFVGYAVYSYYRATPLGDSVPKRVWASVAMAVGAIGAAAMAWVHGMTGSGP